MVCVYIYIGDDCFYYHCFINNVVIAFGTLSRLHVYEYIYMICMYILYIHMHIYINIYHVYIYICIHLCVCARACVAMSRGLLYGRQVLRLRAQ